MGTNMHVPCSTTQHAMEHGAQQKSRHTKLCNINLARKQAMRSRRKVAVTFILEYYVVAVVKSLL